MCYALPFLDCQTLIKSCSIESRNDPSPKSDSCMKIQFGDLQLSTWFSELNRHQTSESVMVSVISTIPTRDNLIFHRNFLKALNVNFVQKSHNCQISDILEKLGLEMNPQLIITGLDTQCFFYSVKQICIDRRSLG